jgi:hypothetical protein
MTSGPARRRRGMAAHQIQRLRALEGRRIGLAVRGGGRIDDGQLVSAGRHGVRTVWVFVDGVDTFVPVDDVIDLWEAA